MCSQRPPLKSVYFCVCGWKVNWDHSNKKHWSSSFLRFNKVRPSRIWMWCFSLSLSIGYFKVKVQYKTGDKTEPIDQNSGHWEILIDMSKLCEPTVLLYRRVVMWPVRWPSAKCFHLLFEVECNFVTISSSGFSESRKVDWFFLAISRYLTLTFVAGHVFS